MAVVDSSLESHPQNPRTIYLRWDCLWSLVGHPSAILDYYHSPVAIIGLLSLVILEVNSPTLTNHAEGSSRSSSGHHIAFLKDMCNPVNLDEYSQGRHRRRSVLGSLKGHAIFIKGSP